MSIKSFKQVAMALLLGCSGLITMQAEAIVIDGTLADPKSVYYIAFNVAQASQVTIDVLANEFDVPNTISVDLNNDGELTYLNAVIHLFAIPDGLVDPANWIAMSMGSGPEGTSDGSLIVTGPGDPFTFTLDPYLSLNLAAGDYVIALGSVFLSLENAANGANPNGVSGGDYRITITIEETVDPVVPEPATMSLLGLGLAGAAIMRRRRMKA